MTSGARSSNSNYDLGASEHYAKDQWIGAIAFSNLGLPGSAFTGNKWSKVHKPALLELFIQLLVAEERPQGLLLCEVGNLSDLITPEGRSRLECVLRLAFQHAGALEHGAPQFFWSKGETMAAFKAELNVKMLKPLTKMDRVDTWRTVDRLKITNATEHGECDSHHRDPAVRVT